MKKTALITGATGGLGHKFCDVFARKNYNLVISARHQDDLKNLKNEIEEKYGIDVHIVVADLSVKNSANIIYEYTSKHKMQIHTLVNNAGFGDFGYFMNSDWDKQADMIQVNVGALSHLTHIYLNEMKEVNEGKILNVASMASFQPGPLMSVYYATKAYVLSFTESLSVELKDYNISIMALCPGPTSTNFLQNADLEESGLFKNLKVAKADKVANYGYRKLQRNKVIALPGLLNKVVVLSSKLAPRSLVRRVVYLIQK